jgi:hypothetical protein
MSSWRRATSIAATAVALLAVLGPTAGPAAAEAHEVVVGPSDDVHAALSAALPGTVVKLKAGTYHQFLNPPAGVTLEGSGTGALDGTVLVWPNSGTNLCSYGVLSALVCMTNGDRVTNLRVDITGSPAVFGIATTGSPTGTSVDDVAVVGNQPADGIFLNGSNVTIRGTETSGFHEGVLVTAVGADVRDNFGHGNCTGIAVFDFGLAGPPFGPIGQASNVTLEGNREQGPLPCPSGTGAGIFLLGAPHSTVRDNAFSGLNTAAIVTASSYSTIDGNTIRDSCLGIDLLNLGIPAPDGPADHDVVFGNEVHGNPATACYAVPAGTFASGVRADGATNATVAGNEVHVSLTGQSAAPVDGIFVDGQSKNVAVTRNEVHEALNGSPGYDVGWDGTGTHITFVRNECSSSNPAGLCAGD